MRIGHRITRVIGLGIVFFVCIGCDNSRNNSSQVWPARLASVDNASTEQIRQIQEIVSDLNVGLARTAVHPDDQGAGYAIRIAVLDLSSSADTYKGGSAQRFDGYCSVELNQELFEGSKAGYLKSVVWHELGHCAGHKHLTEAGEVMSPITQSFSFYSKEKLNRFFSDFRTSVGISN